MAAINLPFGASATRRAPDADELANGYGCGPADIELFDWMGWWTTGQFDGLISNAGLTTDDSDITQGFRAARQLAGESYTAGGTANALTITPGVAFVSLAQLSVVPIRVKATATNTGPGTLVVGAFAAKPIVRFDGSPLAEKDIIVGDDLVLRYDVALDAYRLQSPRAVIGRGCLVSLVTNGLIGNSVEVPLAWDTEAYDTDAMWSATPDAGKFTVPAGVSRVRVVGQVAFEANGSGDRKVRILRNGTIEGRGLGAFRSLAAGGADVTILNFVGGVVDVSPGDYLQVMVIQTSGGNLGIRGSGNSWVHVEIVR